MYFYDRETENSPNWLIALPKSILPINNQYSNKYNTINSQYNQYCQNLPQTNLIKANKELLSNVVTPRNEKAQ